MFQKFQSYNTVVTTSFLSAISITGCEENTQFLNIHLKIRTAISVAVSNLRPQIGCLDSTLGFQSPRRLHWSAFRSDIDSLLSRAVICWHEAHSVSGLFVSWLPWVAADSVNHCCIASNRRSGWRQQSPDCTAFMCNKLDLLSSNIIIQLETMFVKLFVCKLIQIFLLSTQK